VTAPAYGACRDCGGARWVAGTSEYGRPRLRCVGCGRTRLRPRGPGERPPPPPPRVADACRHHPETRARHLVQLPGTRYQFAAVCDACLARLVPAPAVATP